MSKAVDSLAITVGTGCNIRCRHCLVDENLGTKVISGQEIQIVVNEINNFSPGTIVFTGGEPTLYLREIQEILSCINSSPAPKVKLVTNGYFAKTPSKTEQVLNTIRYLSGVVVSYDAFHAEYVKAQNIINILDVCRNLGIKISIASAVESPMDLVFLNSIKRSGVPIAIQQILSIGRAKEQGLEYQYTSFDPEVLGKKCLNFGGMVYNCGAGFTVCCGYLASAAEKKEYVHDSIAAHLKSRFYRLISECTFGEMAKIASVDPCRLLPECSNPCRLCSLLVPRIIGA